MILLPISMGNLANAMPNERRLDTKGHIWVIPLIGNAQNKAVHGDRKCMSGCQELGVGVCSWAWGFLLGVMKMFWNQIAVMVAN